MGKVWDADLAPNHKLVLLAYADAAEHDGTAIFPGEERLRTMTGYSRGQLYAVTNDLLESGVLVRDKPGRRGQRAEFHIDMGVLDLLCPIIGPSTEELGSDPEGLGSGPPDTSRPIPPVLREILPTVVSLGRDEIWDGLVEVFGEPTTGSNQRLRGKLVKSLKAAGATRDQIHLRVAAWPAHFPEATLTETALEKHWDRLGRSPLVATVAQVESYQSEVRRVQREREAVVADAEWSARQRGLPDGPV